MNSFQHSSDSRRITRNTLFLYLRMACLMAINLYTSRVVLKALGVEDYGIYNVVSGLVLLFTSVSTSLTDSISRYLTYEVGTDNIIRLRKLFSSSVIIILLSAIIVSLFAEAVGLWFLNNKIVISPTRFNAAFWVLHLSVVTFIFDMTKIPFKSLIIAHERMSAFAYISILDAVMVLGVCLLLEGIPIDSLKMYAVFLSLTTLLISTIYALYAKRCFSECCFVFNRNKKIYYDLVSFTCWSFLGTSSSVIVDGGVNLLLNVFCGPVVNAARGISSQVSHAIKAFSNNIITALNPQITKSYAQGDFNYSQTLVSAGTRYSSYLLMFISLPILFEAPEILSLWLGVVPEHTIRFVRLIIVYTLVENLSLTLTTLIYATGRIRRYQILTGIIQLLNLPLSYILLGQGMMPETVFVLSIIISIICYLVRITLISQDGLLQVKEYFFKVLINVGVVLFTASLLPTLIYLNVHSGIQRFIIVTFLSLFSVILCVYWIGCNQTERCIISKKLTLLLKSLSSWC